LKRRLTALLLCALAGSALAENKKLVLPTGNDLDTYLKENPGPCTKCGIVVSIKVLDAQEAAKKPSGSTVLTPPAVEPQMMPVGGKAARTERKKMREAPTDAYRVTVHNDDDTYASFDLGEKPDFTKGDRVQLIDGKLQRR